MNLEIEKLLPNATIPIYATEYSAGLDLNALTATLSDGTVITLELGDEVNVQPGHVVIVGTGLRMAIPKTCFGMLAPRSSMGLKGLTVANSPGVIDADYRGEIKILLRNTSTTVQTFGYMDRVAQLLIVPFEQVTIIESPLDETARGAGGLGSTGK